MTFVAIIPARMASSRLPGKPLADIAGTPMVIHVARRAQASRARRVVIATDDPTIAQIAQAHGIEAIMTRSDHPSGTDRLAEAATKLALDPRDTVVNVQGDEPLIEPALIDRMADLLAARAHCAVATAAHPIERLEDYLNPNVVKVLTDAQDHAIAFTRAPAPFARDALAGFPSVVPNQLPASLVAHPALRHIGLYAYRVEFLLQYPQMSPCPIEAIESLEQWRALWHGHRIALARLPAAPHAGVDTPEDLARVRTHFAAVADR